MLPVAPGLGDDEVRRLQAASLPAETAVLVRTSGSSGVPKAVALSAAALATAMPTANAANSARRFNGEKRCKDMDIKRKTHPFFSL